MKHIFTFTLIAFVILSFKEEETKELFPNEFKLNTCRQIIPLTYKRKDKPKVEAKALELNGQELVLLHFDKKDSSVTFVRYYLIAESGFQYLMTKADYENKKESPVFLKFTDKYDRFYAAKCFDKVLAENPDMQAVIKETSLD